MQVRSNPPATAARLRVVGVKLSKLRAGASQVIGIRLVSSTRSTSSSTAWPAPGVVPTVADGKLALTIAGLMTPTMQSVVGVRVGVCETGACDRGIVEAGP